MWDDGCCENDKKGYLFYSLFQIMEVPGIKTQNILATGGIFLIALAMIIYGPNEQCIETEFFGSKIVKCDKLFGNPFEDQASFEPQTISKSNDPQIELNLVGGTWDATSSINDKTIKFEFLEIGSFVQTIYEEDGTTRDTIVGEYALQIDKKKLTLTNDLKPLSYYLYDIQTDSFKAISPKYDITVSFQRN
jgi:hypothetical protein